MSQEFYSYDVSTEYDDDQLHYHEDRHQEVPMGEASKDLKGLSSSAAKDRKKGFFSRLFSSKPKEKGSHTPSLIKQMSQKTPNKTATGKQRSQSAPRMKVSSWQEKTSTEHEKQQFRAMQQAARMERNVTPERRGSFDLQPYEDLGDVDVSPVSFYGSSFHQSMDDYHGPSLYDREVVVGGTKEPPPQPYYLQTYNQLMQQRNQQHQKFQQQKQHLQPPPFQQHQMHHNFAPQNAVRSTIQRSENNSGISTPTEENISRVNSHEVSGDPGLEDPAVQAFMEKRRMKKERSREDKLMREMLQEAAFMGVSPSKLVASDVSTVEEKSTTYPGRPYPDASQFHHVAPIQQQQQSRRPSQTGNYPNPPTGLMELASKSNDSYDRGLARSSDGPYAAHAQPKQRPLHPHEENQFYAPPQHQHHHPHHQNPSSALLASRSNDSYDRPLPPPDALKSRPLPSQPVSPPLPVHDPVAPPVAPAPLVTTVPKATVALQQAPAPPVAAATTAPMTAPVSVATSAGVPVPDLPPHPLHDFVGIPKGVQFDTLHVMHHENAEILKIAAALLQKARRHPQLPKADGIPREVAAAQLATMWLNQATFVRRRAGPEGASSSGKVSSQGQGRPAMVPFPKAPLSRPADPAKARKDPSPTSKLPVNNASGGTTTTANSKNGNAAMTTSSGVPAAVESLTASPSAASPEQQRPASLPVETQVYQPQQQPLPPPPHHPSAASQPLPLPPQHFGAPLRSTKEAPHQSAPNVAYERQPSPAQLPPSQASQQYQAPSTPPPPPLPLPSQPAAVSTIISHYEYLARSGSRDYTPDGGPGSPYLTPSALHDSPPGGQRAGGRKIMRVPVADDPVHQQPPQQQQQPQPQRRPSPMGMMRPEYARERAGSEGRLYEDVSRPGMMSRQTSTNNAPPPLLQQMSKRGYSQQQQQQQQMQHSYDAYDAPPTQYQQQQQQPQYPVATGRGYDSYDVYDDEDEFAAAMAVPPLSSSSRNVSTGNAPSGYYAGGYSNGAMNNGGAHPALHHHASSLSATSATSHMANTVVTANGSWVCKYCTLINDTTHSRCSACEAPRSKGPLIV